MAVTGIFLLGFVIAHLMGNLLIFGGPDALNTYAKKLRDLGPLLWVARLFLLAMVGIHIGTAIILAKENRAARPHRYACRKSIQTTYAARTMVLSGYIVLAFIIYHLLHFTFHVTHPAISHLQDSLGRHDIYSMVILSFQDPLISGAYIFALALLALHLSHGFASLFQSLGLNDDRFEPVLSAVSKIIALLIFASYASIPVAALLGVVKTTGGA